MDNNTPDSSKIPLWIALTPLIALIVMLSCSVYLFSDNSSYGPNQIALMMASGVGIAIAMWRGQTYLELEDALVHGIMLSMRACLILLMVGP
nr:hypothetical protein [Kordiimonas gwangyangensis]